MADPTKSFSPSPESSRVLERLSQANRELARLYPGPSAQRQPIHTVYGGAHLFRAETPARLGELALDAMTTYANDPLDFARGVGFAEIEETELAAAGGESLLERLDRDADALRRDHPRAWLAAAVYARVHAKLKQQPVEDYRIDFEDGYGARPDAEEDHTAIAAAGEVARGLAQGCLPPFLGIRIKSLSEECAPRAARTLELFVEHLLAQTAGRLPDNFVVTLPKVSSPAQASALVQLFELLERRHALPAGSLRLELMIELTQSLLGRDGRSPLPEMLEACSGRCVGAHLGTYDFTASCNVTAAYQAMRHPMCDLAKGLMLLAFGGTGVFLSDGATNVLPVAPHRGPALSEGELRANRRTVREAWRLAHDNIRHSLIGGYYQGWDLHPAQLPVRYAATYAFFLEGFAPAAQRLKNFVDQAARATLAGDVFDDAATGQGLLNYFVRALNCGCIADHEIGQTGLSREELGMRSFAAILAARRERLASSSAR